jgi:hypothetical protein
MSEQLNDYEYTHLSSLVIAKIWGQDLLPREIVISPLQTNYFSFVFSIELSKKGFTKKVFVKVPKEDMRGRDKKILPITEGDRLMARSEADSLKQLEMQWNVDELAVSWVKLIFEVPEYNALITEAAYGFEAFEVFRKWDINRRLGKTKDRDNLRSSMTKLGAALGRFHNHNARQTTFYADREVPKLLRYCKEISDSPFNFPLDDFSGQISEASGKEIDAIEVQTLKGIDIRNILINEKNELFLLDPGLTKSTCREADLARFLMTYRILYWGSKLFALGFRPDKKAEEGFLEAYYKNSSPPSGRLLNYFFVKEQLKHWHTAIDSLNKLRLPLYVRKLIAKTYVTPFYKNQLRNELKKLN